MMRKQKSKYGGFTLIEVLVVLAVVVILQTVAVPAMSAAVDSARLGAVTQALNAALQLSRSEAIKRNARVVLCKSDTGTNCAKTGGWEQGWIVFHDANNNAVVDAGEVVLQREPALTGSVKLAGNAMVESYVSYTAAGQTIMVNGAFQSGTLTLCRLSDTRVQARQVVISSSGRVRTQKVWRDYCA